MRKNRLFITILTLALLAEAMFAKPSRAMSQSELRNEFSAALKYELPPVCLRFEGDLTRAQALQTAVDTLGFSREREIFERLSVVPELELGDAGPEIAKRIEPCVDARFISAGEELLTEEDAAILLNWVCDCSKKLTMNADFVHPSGTELRIYRQNTGTNEVINAGKLENRPLYTVTLLLDPKIFYGEIAVAEAQGLEKRAELSRIAGSCYGAVAAVNGGYFAMDVFAPIGVLRSGGASYSEKVWPSRSAVCWNDAGDVCFVAGSEAAKLRDKNFAQTFPFALQAGPLLLRDGKKCSLTENINIKVLTQRHPRTIFGTDGKKLYITVIDGRDPFHSVGTTIEETKTVCLRLGMKDALNLDGGGSSELLWFGTLVNSLSENGQERKMPYGVIFKRPEGNI